MYKTIKVGVLIMYGDDIHEDFVDLRKHLRFSGYRIIGFMCLGIAFCVASIWWHGLVVGGVLLIVMQFYFYRKNEQTKVQLELTSKRWKEYNKKTKKTFNLK